jgi:D-alanyl-lipoteichoic acid acyltransferase DltB (MBOAT superfamily)
MALYISLFPQLIAGPIVRYTDVDKEIIDRHETLEDFTAGLKMFMVGLGAKVLLANNMAVVADSVFADYKNASSLVLWLAAFAYTLQIYFDFAGYSRMAIGLGRMFGFHFPENFNDPYTATSITDFWRRWHITLSSWFRDYVYIPLGGNRCSVLKHIFNILITWLLTGFWHGAEWNFILWGVYYGVLLIVEKYLVLPAEEISLKKINTRYFAKLMKGAMWIFTMFFVVFGWVLFRTESLSSLGEVIAHLFKPSGIPTAPYFIAHADTMSKLFFMIPAVVCCVPACKKWNSNAVFSFIVFVLSVCMLVASTYNPFIYFRF